MKTIQEAGPTEVAAIKRRTIRTLAMGAIEEKDCDFITNHLDAVVARLELINTNKEEAS
jgi:hypothetical protein